MPGNVPAFDDKIISMLDEKNISYEGQIGEGFISQLINMLLPIFIFFGIWLFIAKKMSKGMGSILGPGKSDKLINSERPNVKFEDVQGFRSRRMRF